MAFRSGDYKIHLKTRERTREPETGKREPSVIRNPPLLFNLTGDSFERRELQRRQPDVVRNLLQGNLKRPARQLKTEPF